MTLIPSLTFTELWVVSMEHLQRVCHVSRERLLFLKPGSVPLFWTNAYVPIVETSFHERAVSFLDFSPLIPLDTFSVLLLQLWSLDCQDMFVILTMSLWQQIPNTPRAGDNLQINDNQCTKCEVRGVKHSQVILCNSLLYTHIPTHICKQYRYAPTFQSGHKMINLQILIQITNI